MMMMPPYLLGDDDEGEYGTGGRIRLKKKFQSIESHDEIIEEEIDEDYVFPMSAICKDNKSHSPGNKIDKAKGKGDSQSMPVPYKADEENPSYPLESQECLITSKDDLKWKRWFIKKLPSFIILPEENKSQSPGMRVPYKADEENLSYPLKSQECLITSKDDLKYQKKIRDFHVLIELKVFSLNRRVREKFRSLVAVCKDNKSQSQECLITSKDELEMKRNVDGEYQKKIRDFDKMIEKEFFGLKGRLRKKFQSLVPICKDNKSQSQECLITSKDDLERKRNVDGEYEENIRDFDIMIEKELFGLKRRLIKKFRSLVAICKDNKSQSQESLVTSKDDLERKRNVDGEYEKKIRDFDIMIESEFFCLKRRFIKKFRSLVAICKDNKSQSQECLVTSKDDLKRKRNVDGEYQEKINGRKRRPIKKFQSLEDEDFVGDLLKIFYPLWKNSVGGVVG